MEILQEYKWEFNQMNLEIFYLNSLAMELPRELKIENFSESKIGIFMGMFIEIVNVI